MNLLAPILAPKPHGVSMTFLALLALSSVFVACSGKSVGEVLSGAKGDPSQAGVVSAARKPSGTVGLAFKGLVGAESYVIFENETADRSAIKKTALKLLELLGGDSTSDSAESREIGRLQHVAGKQVFDFETSYVPVHMNTDFAFCYTVKATLKDGSVSPLGLSRCLLNDQNWNWQRLKSLNVAPNGQMALNWDRLPISGATYEVLRRYPDVKGSKLEVVNNVTDSGRAIDEASDEIYPRCYAVRVKHPLFVKKDTNTAESCITLAKWKEDLKASADAEPPVFDGLKAIEVTRNEGLLAKAVTALSLGVSVNVLLSWDPARDNLTPDRRMTYRIYRAETPFGFEYGKPLATTKAGQLSYTDTTITKGSTYYYLVRALDERDNLDQNLNQKKLPLDLEPPTFAGAVAAQTKRIGGQVRVVLAWNSAQDDNTPPQGIVYEIYRSQSQGEFDSQPLSKVSGVTLFEDGTPETNQIYYYKVNAVDREGNRDLNTKAVLVNTGETPPRFAGLREARLFNKAGRLRWDPAEDDESPTNAIYYRVYRREQAQDFNYRSPLVQTPPGVLQFEDASVDVNKPYWYVVRAVDEQGFEDPNAVEVPMAENKAPVLGTQPVTGNAPVATWDKQNNCPRVAWPTASDDSTAPSRIKYRVYRTATVAPTTPFDEVEGRTRWLDETACNQDREFVYMITAEDADGRLSARSAVGRLLQNQPPTAPIVTYKAIVNGTQVQLKWNTAFDPNDPNVPDDRTADSRLRFRVYRFPKAAMGTSPARMFTSGTRVADLSENAREWIDPTGASGTTEYSWVVRAVDEYDAESANMNEVSLDSNLPPTFTGVTTVTPSGLRAVNLTWSLAADDRTPANLLTYRVYMIEVPANTPTGADPSNPIPSSFVDQLFAAQPVEQILGQVATLTRTLPDANKMYIFGVRAFDAQGVGDENRRAVGVPANNPPTFSGLDSVAELAGGTVRLSWLTATDDKDPSNQLLYRVYRYKSSNVTEAAATVRTLGTLHRTSSAGSTNTEDDSVDPAANNHYLVRAVDLDQAEDANTSVQTVLRDSVAPVFLGIKSSSMDQGGQRITLVWDPAADNRTQASRVRYRIYESLSPVLADIRAAQPVDTLTNGQVSYSRTPPTAAKYYYHVRAVDEAGNMDANESVKFTVDEIPPTFAGLVAAYAITGNSAQVFWTGTPNDDISKVEIYRAEDLTNPVAAVNVRDLQGNWVNSYLITGLTNATSYTLIARASDLYGNEDPNTVAKEITTLAAQSPTFAGLQSASPMEAIPGLNSIRLSWSPAANATHYRIFRIAGTSERGEGFNFNFDTCQASWSAPASPGCLETEASATSAYEVSGLVKNSTYSFIVRAVNKVGGDVVGEELNRVIRKTSTIDEVAPTFDGAANVTPAAGSSGMNTVVVNWSAPKADGVYDGFKVVHKQVAEPSTSFNLPLDLSSDPQLGVTVVADPAALEMNVSNLTYATRYCFTVVTRYVPIASVRSIPTPAGFKCIAPTPQSPQFAGVRSTVVKGNGGLAFTQVTVSWEPAQGSFTGYEVSWSKTNDYASASNTGSFFGGANTATIGTRFTTSHTITGLDSNVTYYYRVRAKFQMAGPPSINLSSGSDTVAQSVTSPNAPSGDGILTATQVGDDQIELKWGAPTNDGLFNRYYIFRASGPNAETDVVSQASANAAASPPYVGPVNTMISENAGIPFDRRVLMDTGLAADTKYCYLTRAAFLNGQGFIGSANNAVKCVEVRINPPQFQGVKLVRTPASAAGFSSLVAEWEPAAGNFTRYQYALGLAPDALQAWVNINGAASTSSITIGGLDPNANYYVKVRAVYAKGSPVVNYASGETSLATGTTTPKSPQHGGLEPIEFLQNPGEVRLRWSSPNPNAEIGGLYDRYLLWRLTGGGGGAQLFNTIDALMSDGMISDTDVNSASNGISKLDSTVTQMDYIGATKLPENVETCFLVRAAFLQGSNFVMSPNQTVRCVTPTASAPLFGGIATLQSIPLSVNGFTQLKATWQAATGNFTRYEIAMADAANSQGWSPVAFRSSNATITNATLTNTDGDQPQASNKLQSFKRYYARVRAIYVGAGNTIYSAGESGELSAVVSPDAPVGDGIKSVAVDKIAGKAPAGRITVNGNVSGLWDKVYVFRSTNTDESAARSEVIARSTVNALNTGFSGNSITALTRSSSTSTSDLTYDDMNVTQGQWNCYVARSAYAAAPWFLSSKSTQTPICKQPTFNPINFSGVSATGTRICQAQADAANPLPCDLDARWSESGASRVELKFASVPQGDIDFFDVYYGYSPNADEILARGVYQSILKGDPAFDTNPDDDVLLVGGDATKTLPGGRLYFLVRARCVGCTFIDSNKNVSNEIVAKRPWLSTEFRFGAPAGTSHTMNQAGPGRFEDPFNYQNFTAQGTSALNATDDYLSSTNPGIFAPRAGTTFAFKYNLTSVGDRQNVEGAALFAADSSPRAAYFDNVGGSFQYREGSLFGLAGASTVYDRRSGRCMWIGGYAGNARDFGDSPVRDWTGSWQVNRGDYPRRVQTFDGKNFAEVYERNLTTASPLPRSLPVLAYNPLRDTVWLFGGLDQGSPQTLRADTWEWDGRAWTLISNGPDAPQTSAGEIGRYGSGVMALDPFRGEMVMVGGRYGVPEAGYPDQNYSQSKRMAESPDSSIDVLTNKTRTDAMVHFTLDPVTQKSAWKKTTTLPGNFPRGYPAALVTVPTDKLAGDAVDVKGLYYFSVTWSGVDNVSRNNVWHYDGTQWSELATTTIPDNTPNSSLLAAYDETKDRIVLTFGRGNNPENKRIWEFNPASAKKGLGQSSYVTRYFSDAPPTFGGMPCFDPERREIVEHGGIHVWNHDINERTSVRERTSQDVFVYRLATDSWARVSPSFDHTGSGHANGPSLERKGVFAQGGYFLRGYNGHWEEWLTSFTSWLFRDGKWSRLFDTDITRKYRTNSNWESGTNYQSGFNNSNALFDSATNKETLHVIHQTDWNNSSPTIGRGRPVYLRSFDGVGWDTNTMDVSDITFPDHRCANATFTPESNWHFGFNSGLNFSTTSTPWGIFIKGPSFKANIPWDPNSGSTNCNASWSVRYARSPFMIAAKESGSWKVRELKAPGSGGPFDPLKWCATVGTSVANPDLHANFKNTAPKMVWDDANQRLLLVATQGEREVYYQKNIQAIKRKDDVDPTKRCFYVENITAPFPNSAWNEMSAYSNAYDTPVWDPVRGKLMVLSSAWTTNAQGDRGYAAGANGYIWELDVKTANSTTPGLWKYRPLPEEFKRWTVLQGNPIRFAQPIPGKPSEFLIMADVEVHDRERPMSNAYILKVTDAAITLRPVPPRFGLTMGADRTSGYLSVPGDLGDVDTTLGATTLYQGRRKIADDITGEHTLFVVYGTSTYSVYMDGNPTPLVANAPWSGSTGDGIYLQNFYLGARWGHYVRNSEYTARQFMGIGNTRVEVDWLRVFDKPLDATEMNQWHQKEDDPQ